MHIFNVKSVRDKNVLWKALNIYILNEICII